MTKNLLGVFSPVPFLPFLTLSFLSLSPLFLPPQSDPSNPVQGFEGALLAVPPTGWRETMPPEGKCRPVSEI